MHVLVVPNAGVMGQGGPGPCLSVGRIVLLGQQGGFGVIVHTGIELLDGNLGG